MDRLRVEGDVAMRYDGQILKGTKVQVTINDSFGEPIKVINGELGFVSMEIDLNSRLRVWVEIENEIKDGDWVVYDVVGGSRKVEHAFVPVLAVKRGQVFEAGWGPRTWGWDPDQA